MWIWIIIVACVIGAIVGILGSNGDDKATDAASGAMAGGCLAAGCLARIAIAAIIILGVLWLFGVLF
jgi:hypothetical protein